MRIATFQKRCAFLKSIKKKETPINLITAKPSTTNVPYFISNSEVTAAKTVTEIKINTVIFNLFIAKTSNKL